MSNLLRVLTYNVYLRPPPISNNDHKNERAPLIARAIFENGEYDVVAFQELFTSFSDRRARLIEGAAARYGYSGVSRGPQRSRNILTCFFCYWLCRLRKVRLVDGGLMTISKAPLLSEPRTLMYTAGVHSDRLAAKGAIYSCIKLPEGRLAHVFNTHLQASYSAPADGSHGADAIIRKKQLAELSLFITECLPPNDGDCRRSAIIVLGDFNIEATNLAETENFRSALSCNGRFEVSDVFSDHQRSLGPVGDASRTTHNEWRGLLRSVGNSGDSARLTPTEAPSRLDYIVLLTPVSLITAADSQYVRPKVIDAEILDFATSDEEPFLQLSDHSAVVATLDFGDSVLM